jgi:hypothetical protein
VAWGYFIPDASYGQTIREGIYPKGNDAVSIEKFEWTAGTEKSPVTARFIIKNTAKNRTIRSVQFTLLATDAQGIILQQNGTTLRRLNQLTKIEPGGTGTCYFEKAFTIAAVADILLKQVIVEYNNGSLEILNN